MEDEIQSLRKVQQDMKQRGFNGPQMLGNIPILNYGKPMIWSMKCFSILHKDIWKWTSLFQGTVLNTTTILEL